MTITAKQEQLCSQDRWDYPDLSALFINCTLKRSPELSHTDGLMTSFTPPTIPLAPTTARDSIEG